MRHWIIVVALCCFACGSENAPEASAQRVEVTVGAHGYEPANINVQAGRDIILAFTRTTNDGCGQVLVVPSMDIRRDLPLNETVEIELPAQQAATNVRFACGMNMLEGTVVVQ